MKEQLEATIEDVVHLDIEFDSLLINIKWNKGHLCNTKVLIQMAIKTILKYKKLKQVCSITPIPK